MPKISIIMPVYNGYDYLESSINSVLNQTYSDFELICVNDASTDNSEQILKYYHEKDPRVLFFTKENTGSGETLNYGIKKAKGEYLCFLDQDDKYANNYLEKMLNSIEITGFDMCICNAYFWEGDKLTKVPYPIIDNNILEIKTIKQKKILNGFYLPQWTKIIRKDFFVKNKIEFPDKENKAHDVPVHYQLVALCDRIGHVKDCIYYHRTHLNQLSYNLDIGLTSLLSAEKIFQWTDENRTIQSKEKIRCFFKLLIKRAACSTDNVAIIDRLVRLTKNNFTFFQSFSLLFRLKKVKKDIIKKNLLPKPYLVNLGKNSYCAAQPVIVSSNTCIGCFCSLGENIRIGHGEHPLNYLSTSPYFYYDSLGWKHKDTISHNEFWYYPPVQIGNDVWIGDNVLIKNGLHIGDGAVIGMGAVVTKDVPPYAIVAGNPAKIIRYRFNEETIQKLLKLKWWNMDDEILKKLPYDDIDDVISKLINVG